MQKTLIWLTIGIYLVAFGTIWMAYEQRQADKITEATFMPPMLSEPMKPTPPIKGF